MKVSIGSSAIFKERVEKKHIRNYIVLSPNKKDNFTWRTFLTIS